MLFNFEGESLPKKRIVGVYDEEVPPVPIPNTVVKLLGAENTWLATARENRAMPTFSSFFIPKNKRRSKDRLLSFNRNHYRIIPNCFYYCFRLMLKSAEQWH